jgi:hypothetical protein
MDKLKLEAFPKLPGFWEMPIKVYFKIAYFEIGFCGFSGKAGQNRVF